MEQVQNLVMKTVSNSFTINKLWKDISSPKGTFVHQCAKTSGTAIVSRSQFIPCPLAKYQVCISHMILDLFLLLHELALHIHLSINFRCYCIFQCYHVFTMQLLIELLGMHLRITKLLLLFFFFCIFRKKNTLTCYPFELPCHLPLSSICR